MEVNEEAVQIMTMHISKGLEFEVVFALGLSSRTAISEEIDEIEAEKLRQLYVAMTRAKKRLYVPIAQSKKDPEAGTHSPMELFARYFEAPFVQELNKLSEKESITLEHLSAPFTLSPAVLKSTVEKRAPLLPRAFSPIFISSFTTLATLKESDLKYAVVDSHAFTLQTMPRGSETGVAIHQIFEELFSGVKPIWRDPLAIDALVSYHLRFSPLQPWEGAIQQMVRKTVNMPLLANGEFFSLSEMIEFQVEMEFIFSSAPNFVKGFIDLVFCRKGFVYFVDWKTNWLEDYGQQFLEKAMDAHDYRLQAALYKEAIERHFKRPFGGAYYLFVRGGTYING